MPLQYSTRLFPITAARISFHMSAQIKISPPIPIQPPSHPEAPDPIPNPEPASPSLDEPDPGVFHHDLPSVPGSLPASHCTIHPVVIMETA